MKTKLPLLIAAIIFSFSNIIAQTSNMGFSFQGYAVDLDGKSITNENIDIKFTLSPGTYTETHNAVATDAFGVFNAIVGSKTPTEFAKLDFTAKTTIYSLKVEVKKSTAASYTTIHDGQMNAVPYARHAANGVPVGTIVAYGGSITAIPEGWFLCDGSAKAKLSYPQLFAIISGGWGTSGTDFNVPDLRGRFLRGVDGATTRDDDAATRTASSAGGNTGDKVGSLQPEGFKLHNHVLTDPTHTHVYGDIYLSESGGTVVTPILGDNTSYDSNNSGNEILRTSQPRATGITIADTGGNETRPENAAVYYIIKY